MTKTLLVVDDSATMRKVFEWTLLGEDVSLVTHDGGDSLQARARDARPAAAIVDVALANKTGYEVCRALKADPVLGAIPVLLLFSEQNPLDATKAAECGADGSIAKPFETQVLIDRVKQLLSDAQPQGQPSQAPQPRQTAVGGVTASAVPLAPGAVPSAVRTIIGSPTGSQVPLRATQGLASSGSAPVPPAPSPSTRPATGEARSLSSHDPDSRANAISTGVVHPSAPRPTDSSPPHARGPVGLTPSPLPRAAATPAAVVSPSQQRPAIALPPDLEARVASLGLTPAQVEAVAALTREVVERVVWEVVPPLAETMIREEIRRLTAE